MKSKRKKVRKPKNYADNIFHIFDSGEFGEVICCSGFASNDTKELRNYVAWLIRAAEYLESQTPKGLRNE